MDLILSQAIAPQFKETDAKTLETIVTRYHEQDTWKTDTTFTQDAFNLLQNILDEAGELEKRAEYSALVNTDFSKNAK